MVEPPHPDVEAGVVLLDKDDLPVLNAEGEEIAVVAPV
jgi:hypothetical protein